jgi:hypothetical protein
METDMKKNIYCTNIDSSGRKCRKDTTEEYALFTDSELHTNPYWVKVPLCEKHKPD